MSVNGFNACVVSVELAMFFTGLVILDRFDLVFVPIPHSNKKKTHRNFVSNKIKKMFLPLFLSTTGVAGAAARFVDRVFILMENIQHTFYNNTVCIICTDCFN